MDKGANRAVWRLMSNVRNDGNPSLQK